MYAPVAGQLTLPYVMGQCGLVLGLTLLVMFCAVSVYSVRPGRYCSPRHSVPIGCPVGCPFTQWTRDEGSACVKLRGGQHPPGSSTRMSFCCTAPRPPRAPPTVRPPISPPRRLYHLPSTPFRLSSTRPPPVISPQPTSRDTWRRAQAWCLLTRTRESSLSSRDTPPPPRLIPPLPSRRRDVGARDG